MLFGIFCHIYRNHIHDCFTYRHIRVKLFGHGHRVNIRQLRRCRDCIPIPLCGIQIACKAFHSHLHSILKAITLRCKIIQIREDHRIAVILFVETGWIHRQHTHAP